MSVRRERSFIFDDLIESTDNVTRRVNAAVKHPHPVLAPDRPWEGGRALLFGRVLLDEDDGLHKMWYCTGADYEFLGYATSVDGLAWEKPELDVVLVDGQRTNIVYDGRGTTYFEPFGVVKDWFDADPSRRYKAGFKSAIKPYDGPDQHPHMPSSKRGLGTLVSPDGIHWRLEDPFANPDVCDIAHFFQDPDDGRFVVLSRTRLTPETNDGRWQAWGWGRAVARIDSTDFRSWTREKLVFAADGGDPEGTEIYSLSAFPYAGRYIGLAQLFYDRPDQGRLDMQLVTSRDGWTFARVEPRAPFIAEGEIGQWDRFNIAVGDMPPVATAGQLRFYYSGRNYRHAPYDGPDSSGERWSAIGLASIARGRFLGLEASFDGGMVTTTPLQLDGDSLTLNANARYGRVDVQVLGEDGGPIEGWQATVEGEDSCAIPVRFSGGHLEQLRERAVRLRFRLLNAQLYGFELGARPES